MSFALMRSVGFCVLLTVLFSHLAYAQVFGTRNTPSALTIVWGGSVASCSRARAVTKATQQRTKMLSSLKL